MKITCITDGDIVSDSEFGVDKNLATKCIVCSESVLLTQLEEEKMVRYGMTIGSKVCGKCKQAILYIRERIEREAQEGI